MIRSTRQHSSEKSPAFPAFQMQICLASGGLLPEIPCTWKNGKRSPQVDSTYGSPGHSYSARTPDTDGTVSGESTYAELSLDICPSPLRLDDSVLEDEPPRPDMHDLHDLDSDDTTLAETENSPSSTASMNTLPQISSFKLQIVDRLLSEIGDWKGPDGLPPFKSEQQSSVNGSDHNHAADSPQPDSKPSNTSERDQARHFRHSESGNEPKSEYDKDGEDESDDRDDRDDHNKRSRIGGFPSVQRASRNFACPYYKRYPSLPPTAPSCVSPGFATVSRLKDHLSRNHGYTQEQERELKSRQRRIPEDEQWRELYKALFQEDREALENIPSPYCDDNAEELTRLGHYNAAFDRHKQENRMHQSATSYIGQFPDITRVLQEPRNSQSSTGVGINESFRTSALHSLEMLESYVLARSRNVDGHRSFLLLTQNLRDYIWYDSSMRGWSDESQLSTSDSLTDDESEDDSSLNSDSSEETTGGVEDTVTELSPSDGNSQPNLNREGQATISTGTNSGSGSDPQGSSGSKKTRQRDNDEGNDGDDKPPDPKRPRRTSAGGNQRLACHYFKKNSSNPALERVCKPPGFTSFQRLKEHLVRKHDLGCHLCYKCFECFNTVRETQDHRENSCPGFGEEKLGFTPDQKAHINLISSKRKLSDVEKWRAIWRILFEYDQDAVNNIPSPYYGDRISMFADMMRSELVNQGLSHEDRAEAWQMWEGFVAFVNSRQRSIAADSRSLSSVPPSEIPNVQDASTLNPGNPTVSHNGHTPVIRHPPVIVPDTAMPANDASNGLSSLGITSCPVPDDHNHTSENEPPFHFLEQIQQRSSVEATGQEFPFSIAPPLPATNEALHPFTSSSHYQPEPVRRRGQHSFNDRPQVVQDNAPTNPLIPNTGSNDPLWYSGGSLSNMSNVDFWNSLVNFGES